MQSNLNVYREYRSPSLRFNRFVEGVSGARCFSSRFRFDPGSCLRKGLFSGQKALQAALRARRRVVRVLCKSPKSRRRLAFFIELPLALWIKLPTFRALLPSAMSSLSGDEALASVEGLSVLLLLR